MRVDPNEQWGERRLRGKKHCSFLIFLVLTRKAGSKAPAFALYQEKRTKGRQEECKSYRLANH